jgi:hypothetical protein
VLGYLTDENEAPKLKFVGVVAYKVTADGVLLKLSGTLPPSTPKVKTGE